MKSVIELEIGKFAVVENGKIVTTINRLTGAVEQEIYRRKSTAQQVADWYNKQEAG